MGLVSSQPVADTPEGPTPLDDEPRHSPSADDMAASQQLIEEAAAATLAKTGAATVRHPRLPTRQSKRKWPQDHFPPSSQATSSPSTSKRTQNTQRKDKKLKAIKCYDLASIQAFVEREDTMPSPSPQPRDVQLSPPPSSLPTGAPDSSNDVEIVVPNSQPEPEPTNGPVDNSLHRHKNGLASPPLTTRGSVAADTSGKNTKSTSKRFLKRQVDPNNILPEDSSPCVRQRGMAKTDATRPERSKRLRERRVMPGQYALLPPLERLPSEEPQVEDSQTPLTTRAAKTRSRKPRSTAKKPRTQKATSNDSSAAIEASDVPIESVDTNDVVLEPNTLDTTVEQNALDEVLESNPLDNANLEQNTLDDTVEPNALDTAILEPDTLDETLESNNLHPSALESNTLDGIPKLDILGTTFESNALNRSTIEPNTLDETLESHVLDATTLGDQSRGAHEQFQFPNVPFTPAQNNADKMNIDSATPIKCMSSSKVVAVLSASTNRRRNKNMTNAAERYDWVVPVRSTDEPAPEKEFTYEYNDSEDGHNEHLESAIPPQTSVDNNGASVDDNGVSVDEDGISVDDNAASLDDDGVTADDNGVIIDGNGASADKSDVSADDNAVSADDDGVSADVNGASLDVNGLIVDGNGASADYNGVSADDSVSDDDNGVPADGYDVSANDNGVSADDNGTSPAKDVSPHPSSEPEYKKQKRRVSKTRQSSESHGQESRLSDLDLRFTAAYKAITTIRELHHPPQLRPNGELTGDEEELVRRAIKNYQEQKGIGLVEVVDIVQFRHSVPGVPGVTKQVADEFWRQIARFNPARRLISIKSFLQSRYHIFKGEGWSENELEVLRDLYKQHGNKWKLISQIMRDRTPKDISNYCRYHLVYKEPSAIGEEKALVRAVNTVVQDDQYRRAKMEEPPLAEYKISDIDWNRVSELCTVLGHARKPNKCRSRWENMLRRDQGPFYGEGRIPDPDADDEPLLQQIKKEPETPKTPKTPSSHFTFRRSSTKPVELKQMRLGDKFDLVEKIFDHVLENEDQIDWHEIAAKMDYRWSLRTLQVAFKELLDLIPDQGSVSVNARELFQYLAEEHSAEELRERYDPFQEGEIEQNTDDVEEANSSYHNEAAPEAETPIPSTRKKLNKRKRRITDSEPTPGSTSAKARKTKKLRKLGSQNSTPIQFKSLDFVTASDDEASE